MFSIKRLLAPAPAGAILSLTMLGLVGCAHVNQEDMDASMARMESQLRQEMLAGDADLSARVDGLEDRVGDLEAQTDRLESELAQLSQEFDATVTRLAASLRFAAPVQFGFDDATLTTEHRQMLDRFAAVVRENYPGYMVTVEGFTDAVGTPEYNMALGLRRAHAVRTYLTEQGGLSADRVRAVSYGEAANRMVAPSNHGPGEAGMANRRVALVVEHVG
jgi:peptidoglycan-associated lipoprotein